MKPSKRDWEEKKRVAEINHSIREILKANPPYEYYDIDGKVHIISRVERVTGLIYDLLSHIREEAIQSTQREMVRNIEEMKENCQWTDENGNKQFGVIKSDVLSTLKPKESHDN